MIAVTFAVPSESRDFRRLIDGSNHRISLLHTGVGEKVTRERLAPFLAGSRFELLISSGFAGGIDPSLEIGDLLLAKNYSDPQLLARAEELLIATTGTLATADRILATSADRAAFARAHDTLAVDMETAAIAEACAAASVPLLSLRVISDTVAAPFPAPPEVLFDLARQKTSGFALASYLGRHPGGIPRLLRFAGQIRRARRSLTGALAVLVREL